MAHGRQKGLGISWITIRKISEYFFHIGKFNFTYNAYKINETLPLMTKICNFQSFTSFFYSLFFLGGGGG